MIYQNRLIGESSPYLRQHADNPVQWYPWGKLALQKARDENKPILLSIGYAACHWCHVMAHESFADEQTAELMNQWFVNIKVDREERPDLDKIYQTAHQLLTGRAGGWPLTVFLTPDQHMPFYAGTYFPLEESMGRPAFKTVLKEVAHFYYERRDAIDRLTQALTSALAKIAAASCHGVTMSEAPLLTVREELEKSFDFIHGGFGRAPKFPLPTHLNTLMQNAYFSAGKDTDALKMLDHSLTRMAQGGFYDQLGGGFFRYCVDSNWMIPHFEKMLYDNAQLIPIFARRGAMLDKDLFKETALAAVAWILREMRSPQGGFYSSLNADSEGIEGKFYIWDREEIRRTLNSTEYSSAIAYFGLKNPPNFEGHWHLYIAEQDPSIHAEWLPAIKQKLLARRQTRIHPSCDKKIITSWNALMIKALTQTALALARPDFVVAAQNALDFIFENLWENQRLLAVSTEGCAELPAYLDDYAFLLDALLEYLQIRWKNDYFQWAVQLAEQMLTLFYDTENGGFFYTALDHEPLIQRPKIFADEALPAGNGIAILSLLRLGYLLGEPCYLQAAEKTLQASWEQLQYRPSAHDSVLTGLRSFFHPPTMIILRGESSLLAPWQNEFAKYYLPNHFCYALSSDTDNLPPALQKPLPPKDEIFAYICRGNICEEPIKTWHDFSSYLKKISIPVTY